MRNQTGKRTAAGLCALVSLGLIICGLVQVTQAVQVYCRDVYSTCTEGGCGATEDWQSYPVCGIWCNPSNQFARIICAYPEG